MGRKKTVVPPVPLNRKNGIVLIGSSSYVPRVTHRAARGKKLPRFKVACGCCNESFKVYYDSLEDPACATLEIDGVDASVHNWREILLPLLGFYLDNGVWLDTYICEEQRTGAPTQYVELIGWVPRIIVLELITDALQSPVLETTLCELGDGGEKDD